MAKDLLGRVRAALSGHDVAEKKMFGGIAFMVGGRMVASVSKRGLLLRVGKDGQAAALEKPGAMRVEMGKGRPMSGYVRISENGLTEAALARWLKTALAVAAALPVAKGGVARPTPRAR